MHFTSPTPETSTKGLTLSPQERLSAARGDQTGHQEAMSKANMFALLDSDNEDEAQVTLRLLGRDVQEVEVILEVYRERRLFVLWRNFWFATSPHDPELHGVPPGEKLSVVLERRLVLCQRSRPRSRLRLLLLHHETHPSGLEVIETRVRRMTAPASDASWFCGESAMRIRLWL